MDWGARVDAYCERTGTGLLAEPVNLLSNLAFIAAAALVWGLYRRRCPRMDVGIAALIGLTLAVGVGSALFHSFATGWALVADVAPITAFMYLYLGHYLRAVVAWPWWRVGAGLVVFAAVNALAGRIPSAWLNGSEMYLGAFLALLALAPLGRRRDARLPGRLRVAAAIFAVSLAARTLDMVVCPHWPQGTHFAWHLLNGVLLYLLLRAVIEARAGRRL